MCAKNALSCFSFLFSACMVVGLGAFCEFFVAGWIFFV